MTDIDLNEMKLLDAKRTLQESKLFLAARGRRCVVWLAQI
jgi:hypothetical protein